MEVNTKNIDSFNEVKLLKLISKLRHEINNSKVGKAAYSSTDAKSIEYSSLIKEYRKDYQYSISRLRKLRSRKENERIKKNFQQRQIEKNKIEEKLKEYQSESPEKYRFITNFNKSYKVNTMNNDKEIFSTYL
jgi:hypothetical protein